jgi:hypothetical protein
MPPRGLFGLRRKARKSGPAGRECPVYKGFRPYRGPRRPDDAPRRGGLDASERDSDPLRAEPFPFLTGVLPARRISPFLLGEQFRSIAFWLIMYDVRDEGIEE